MVLRGRRDEPTSTSSTAERSEGTPWAIPHEPSRSGSTPLPGYDDDAERRYPSVYVIQGLTGQLDVWRNRSPFRRNFPELADDLFARGDAPPVIVVWVDCWTSLGGSQFLDSPGTGNYLTYLCDEIVPFVDERYRTIADRDHRGIQGKSSGGYGAMVRPDAPPGPVGWTRHACRRRAVRDVLPARSSASPLACSAIEYDGSFDAFWKDFRSRPAFSKRRRRPPAERLVHGGVLFGRSRTARSDSPSTPRPAS